MKNYLVFWWKCERNYTVNKNTSTSLSVTKKKNNFIFALEMKTQKQHISLNLYRSAIDFPMDINGRCMCFYEE